MLPLLVLTLCLSASPKGPPPDHEKLVAGCRKACEMSTGCEESCARQGGPGKGCQKLCAYQKDQCKADCNKNMPNTKKPSN
jgi:hypothetical protein